MCGPPPGMTELEPLARMRVLIVGPTAGTKRSTQSWFSPRSGLMFYCFANRLANGFVRNGHFVAMFNDRDARRHVLNVRQAAAWLANQRLLRLARDIRPDLLCLQHCDLISAATVEQIKKEIPQCRVAAVYYDSLHVEKSAARFRRFLDVADFGFATTAGATLRQFADVCPVAFIPNPVDLSIDNLRAYAVAHKPVDVFCAFGTSGRADRWGLIDELRRLKPDLRYGLHGRDKVGRIFGNAYYERLDEAKVGLNLNTDEGDLYSSDRMAQYLGNGLLLATSRASGYERCFNDDEMIFFDDVTELADRLEWAFADDDRWRNMAQRARAKAAEIMAGELVTDFIIRTTMGSPPPAAWQFKDEVYGLRHFADKSGTASRRQSPPMSRGGAARASGARTLERHSRSMN